MVAMHYSTVKNRQHETQKGRRKDRKVSENGMVEFIGDMGCFGNKRR